MRIPHERARRMPGRPTHGAATFPPTRRVQLSVEPEDLERELRACLAEQVAAPAPPASQADAIIRRGNRTLRRRTVGSAVALVVATTLATVGVVQLGFGPSTPPKLSSLMAEPMLPTEGPVPGDSADPGGSSGPSVRDTRIAVSALQAEVVTGERLVPTTGPTISLKPVGPVSAAYGVSGGWLVTTAPAPAATSVWYVRRAGSPVKLLSDVDGLALSADGTRVAWGKSGRLFLAELAGGALTTRVVAPADGGSPVGFAGDSVLVRRPRVGVGSTDATELGVWTGAASRRPAWRAEASDAYGTLSDRRTVVARLGDRSGADGQRGCVGLLDAARSLAPQRRACGLPLSPVGPGWVSPDGHWLVAAGRNGRAVAVDLDDAFQTRPTAVDAGALPDGPAIWLNAQTFMYGGGHQLFRLRLANAGGGDASAELESIALSGLSSTERVQVIPHLGN
jgi:hypothetical protein